MGMKSKKKVHSSPHLEDNEQILLKVDWTRNKWGGMIGKNKEFDRGDLLRPAMLDEVIPEKESYFIRPNGTGRHFYLLYQGFSKTAEYEDIKQFVANKMVWVYKNFNIYE